MKELMSESLRVKICNQIAHEIYNSNLYMVISGFLKNKGLDNIAKLFEHQREEELEHSIYFFNLLTDLNADIFIPEIDEVNMDFSSIEEIAKTYLEREIVTTKSIDEIKNLAIVDENPVVEEFMRKMIEKQQLEYAEASTFLDKASVIKEWWQCVLWDASYDS